MRSKNGHMPEHISFPPDKPIERGVLNKKGCAYELTSGQRKVLKKTHAKRSRRQLKERLFKEGF